MPNTSANQHYWQDAISAISCVFRYRKAKDDQKEHRIRYEDFLENLAALRVDYGYCRALLGTEFHMDDEAADDWFGELVVNPERLQAVYDRAIWSYAHSEPAVPLRLL